VRAQLSRIHSGGSPTPAQARPRVPSAADTSSARTHRSAFGGGGPAPTNAPTTPSATNPGGGTGRHSTSPSAAAAAAASELGRSTTWKDTGGAVKAGESRMTRTGSDGGFSVPIDTTSPRGAYPGGGRGRHRPHPAAPTRALDTPSVKPEAPPDEAGEDCPLDHTLWNTRQGCAGAAAVAAARRLASRESSARRSADRAKESGDAPTLTQSQRRDDACHVNDGRSTQIRQRVWSEWGPTKTRGRVPPSSLRIETGNMEG